MRLAVDRVVGLREADDVRVGALRGVPDADDVRFDPEEDAEDDAFVDFARELGDVCFVATGVRDSLVAPSARRN